MVTQPPWLVRLAALLRQASLSLAPRGFSDMKICIRIPLLFSCCLLIPVCRAASDPWPANRSGSSQSPDFTTSSIKNSLLFIQKTAEYFPQPWFLIEKKKNKKTKLVLLTLFSHCAPLWFFSVHKRGSARHWLARAATNSFFNSEHLCKLMKH